jgi:hypothetical protein
VKTPSVPSIQCLPVPQPPLQTAPGRPHSAWRCQIADPRRATTLVLSALPQGRRRACSPLWVGCGFHAAQFIVSAPPSSPVRSCVDKRSSAPGRPAARLSRAGSPPCAPSGEPQTSRPSRHQRTCHHAPPASLSPHLQQLLLLCFMSRQIHRETLETQILSISTIVSLPPPPAPPPPDASARGHFGGAGWGKVPRQVPLLLRTAPSMRRNAGTWSNLCCFVRRLAALQARTGTAHPRHVRARSTEYSCTVGVPHRRQERSK